MLGIRRETDYAVRTVLHLASVGPQTQVQVRDVAEQKLLPLSFVRRIVAKLRGAGILVTTRGMGGGIQLARPASEISLLDVLEAMDDGVELNKCLDSDHSCPLADSCPVHTVWSELAVSMEAHLASIRFDALAIRSTRHAEAHRKLTEGKSRSRAGLPARAATPRGRDPGDRAPVEPARGRRG